ncbi:MAG: hypothetical protein JSV84_09235 [Gemmatimonadota bacterium]|nr:MAG: hypothetical protein JSV84_09235 [Gemmatimonadota bacterium]
MSIVCTGIIVSTGKACTTAIISGKATVDGRPLLFKHRDSDSLDNKLMFFDDGIYEYIGLINSSDSLGEQVWAGCNSVAFAIMNSASYNLNVDDTSSIQDREGFIMKQALRQCATLENFEDMLRNLPKPMGVEANFGVIDAKGGAAYYETSNHDFRKYDANDPSIAPFGYIIRTNYSYIGEREEDYGLIRYQTAEDLFYTAYNTHALSSKFLLRNVSRCLKHSLTNTDLTQTIPLSSENPHFVFFQDFIPRYYSSATVVVQGVKLDEPPELTTMWTILGFQLCSVAVPVWVQRRSQLPKLLTAEGSKNAPLCEMALKLKEKCIPILRGSGCNYLNLAAVLNQENNGILQKIEPLEDEILKVTEMRLKSWEKSGVEPQAIQNYYLWLDLKIVEHFNREFGFQYNVQ